MKGQIFIEGLFVLSAFIFCILLFFELELRLVYELTVQPMLFYRVRACAFSESKMNSHQALIKNVPLSKRLLGHLQRAHLDMRDEKKLKAIETQVTVRYPFFISFYLPSFNNRKEHQFMWTRKCLFPKF